jgi:mycoredoxin
MLAAGTDIAGRDRAGCALRITRGQMREKILTGRLTMYTTTWCGYCVRLKHGLQRAGVDFDEVNIEEDPTAEEFVLSVNGGMATVPTLKLPNGEVLTNPPLPELLAAIAA